MLSSDPFQVLTTMLVDGGMLEHKDVATWFHAVREAKVDPYDPVCLTLVPGPKRALEWAWRPQEWPWFLGWLSEVFDAYDLGKVSVAVEGPCLYVDFVGERLVVDWHYVNRERWFGGVATLFNRALRRYELTMEAFETSWVNVIVAVGRFSTMNALCSWFGECQ